MKIWLLVAALWLSFSASAEMNPVVYGVSPLYLSYGHDIPGLVAIRKRIPEIADL